MLQATVFVTIYVIHDAIARDYLFLWINFSIGRYDLAIKHGEQTMQDIQAMEDEEWVRRSNAEVLIWIAVLQEAKGNYDEAIHLLRDEVLPTLAEFSDDVVEVGMVYIDLANLYKTESKYDLYLKTLEEALEILNKSQEKSQHTRLLEIINGRIADAKRFVELKGLQERFVVALINAAHRYEFSSRSIHEGIPGSFCSKRMEHSTNGPFKVFPFVTVYALGSLFCVSVLWLAVSYVRRKISLQRGVIACLTVLIAVALVIFSLYWNEATDMEKFVMIGLLQSRLGNYQNALLAYDGARCQLLANPYAAHILSGPVSSEVAFDTFIGPMAVYHFLGDEESVLMMTEDICAIFGADEFKRHRTSLLVYYQILIDMYTKMGNEAKAKKYLNLYSDHWFSLTNYTYDQEKDTTSTSDETHNQTHSYEVERALDAPEL